MPRFSTTVRQRVKATETTTHEGGIAYQKSVEEEWANYLTSYLFQKEQPSFYEDAGQKEERFTELTKAMIELHGPLFVAKAAVYARNELGMRSLPTYLAAMLNSVIFEGKRDFFHKFFRRPDDVSECFSAVDYLGGKLSHGLAAGAGRYLSGLDAYRLGKYKMKSREYNIYDIVRLTHANSPYIDQLMNDELELPDTWEVAISTAKDSKEKESEWRRLVEDHRLGYLALLRNLRNILSCSFVTVDWISTYIVPQLTNETAIRRSLVFPYQIYTAYRNIANGGNLVGVPSIVTSALEDAFRKSTSNLPNFDGNTLVILDVSGSMESRMSDHSDMTIKEVCAVYAIALYLASDNVDLVKFAEHATVSSYSKLSPVFDIIEAFARNDGMGGCTYTSRAFDIIGTNLDNKRYDRIFLFSDMQTMDPSEDYYGYGYGWSRVKSTREAYNDYCKASKANPEVYSFDLGSYHTQVLPQGRIHYITALSDKVIGAIGKTDGKKSILDIIRDYDF